MDPGHFKLRSQQFIKDSEDKSLLVWYRSYQEVGNKIVPEAFRILAQENDKQLLLTFNIRTYNLMIRLIFLTVFQMGIKK